jgi:hypothetical protein
MTNITRENYQNIEPLIALSSYRKCEQQADFTNNVPAFMVLRDCFVSENLINSIIDSMFTLICELVEARKYQPSKH